MRKFFSLTAASLLAVLSGAADALAAGRSEPWQMWLQEPMSPVAEKVHDLNLYLMILEGGIVVFVLALMIYIVVRFSEKNNPVPSKTSHNTLLEIIWTVIPIAILVVIAVPSLRFMYYADKTVDAEMTLKVTGNQWYWTYEYPDHGEFEFDSIIIEDDELEEGQPRMLSVDNSVVLPINTKIRILLASNDVIHNWAMPSLAVKLDVVPGRTNETWTEILKEGDYYGMCSELCGVNHGFMPIHIKAVSKEAFEAWTKEAQEEFGAIETAPTTVQVAAAQ